MSDFEETLHHYQNGSFSEKYNSDEGINDIKYNTGDWEYQCFETINVLSEEQLNQIFNNFPDDDYKYWNQFKESLMELFCECLLEFENSDVFKSIPKSDSFLLLCMDHDDDLQLAQERLERVKFQFKNS
ncbi:hypothetical protein FLACOL7796_00877 [Flavobacterium collinsii]|uniref:Uncharacterized protein n=1 Tax=Flavobacterium collinsii TaxID=1114861 RepID=A0ABN7EIK9_9FLAO|nr:hypothetical protein FLACOL7796_00877 [Flavobacterium collinsii]